VLLPAHLLQELQMSHYYRNMDAFVQHLIARLDQEPHLTTEAQEARWLGIDRSLWNRVLRGHTTVSPTLLVHALERYPDLAVHVPQNIRLRKARRRLRAAALQTVA
jgi:hypothetical protein